MTDVRHAYRTLRKSGVLLLQDAILPNLAGMIAGGPIKGSWWGHERGAEIFNAAGALDDHRDIMTVKLVSGKVTFVHRTLWPALACIGRARLPWQLDKLTAEARDLLAMVDEAGQLAASGKAANQLERVLLVVGRQVHTDSGRHVLELATWKHYARAVKLPLRRRSAERAMAEIEAVVDELNARFGANGKLPWR